MEKYGNVKIMAWRSFIWPPYISVFLLCFNLDVYITASHRALLYCVSQFQTWNYHKPAGTFNESSVAFSNV